MTDLEEFQAAHLKVKAGFTYVSDERQYGESEKWVDPVDVTAVTGDCEDFALAVRHVCREAEVKTRLLFCTLDGAGHIVLEHKGYISDCGLMAVHSHDELEDHPGTFGLYRWISLSGFEPGDGWKKVDT